MCLYPINVKTAKPIGPIFLWDLAWLQGKVMDDQIFKNLPLTKFDFWKYLFMKNVPCLWNVLYMKCPIYDFIFYVGLSFKQTDQLMKGENLNFAQLNNEVSCASKYLLTFKNVLCMTDFFIFWGLQIDHFITVKNSRSCFLLFCFTRFWNLYLFSRQVGVCQVKFRNDDQSNY